MKNFTRFYATLCTVLSLIPWMSSSADVSGPVVFQCKGCRTIVGDSLAFVTADAGTKTLTLSAASRISRSADVLSSPSSDFAGCSFHTLHCDHCQAQIGRVFISTSRRHDALRDAFTLDTEAIISHALGSSEYTGQAGPASMAPPRGVGRGGRGGGGGGGDGGGAGGGGGGGGAGELEAMQRELTKVGHC